MTTVASALASARQRFHAAGIDSAALDARLLLCEAAGLDLSALISASRETLADDVVGAFDGFCERRMRREPVARILGTKEFRGLPFSLNEATLVPRPETEILVDAALRLAAGDRGRPLRICDLGTGSGVILITLLRELEHATGIGIDISPAALDIVLINARRHGVADRIKLIHGDFAMPLAETFDMVVANPPYVAQGELAGLQADVREYDPVLALDGGPDGLAALRVIAAQLPVLLEPGGSALVEIGAGQSDSVVALIAGQGLEICNVNADLAGIERVIVAKKPIG